MNTTPVFSIVLSAVGPLKIASSVHHIETPDFAEALQKAQDWVASQPHHTGDILQGRHTLLEAQLHPKGIEVLLWNSAFQTQVHSHWEHHSRLPLVLKTVHITAVC